MISKSYSLTDVRQIVVAADNIHRTVYVNIVGNATAYLGGVDVTDSNGLPKVKHDTATAIVVPAGETLYGVMASGATETLRVLLPDLD
jgi:hypothetical protein